MRTSQMPRPSNRCEVFVGRMLAMCTHPSVAWRTQTRWTRCLMLASYFTAGYAAVLAALVLLA